MNPTGSIVRGASPGHPLLNPVLSQKLSNTVNRQQELLDLQAIQRIPGLVGYWKNDPEYLFEDSAGTTPASVGGVVGLLLSTTNSRTVGQELIGALPTPTIQDNAGTVGVWSAGTQTMTNTGSTVGGYPRFLFAYSPTAGARYLIRGTLTGAISKIVFIRCNSVLNYNSATGVFEGEIINPGTSQLEILTNLVAGESLVLASLSIKPVSGNHAVQPTTANKPILRRTPTTGVWWNDSNTSTSALNVALSDAVLGRRNLLPYSEQLEASTWTKDRLTITANIGNDPDGNATYDKLIEDTTASNTHYCYNPGLVTGVQQTISLDIKADTRQSVFVRAGSNNTQSFYFNASTNTFSSVGAGVTNNTATLLPNGAYRVVFTATPASNLFYIYLSAPTANYTGDGVSGLYVGRVQAELGAVATDYQKIVSAPAYCTLARSTPEGVVFTENTEITPTYNLAPAFAFNTDVAIFNRALTTTEKALITRYMQRSQTIYGSLQNAIPQIRGYVTNNETVPGWSSITNFTNFWRYGGNAITNFPLITTSSGTNFSNAWNGCSGLTSFPLINTASGTSLVSTWSGCTGLTSFPLINTASVFAFGSAWYGCSGLTSFPLLNTGAGTNFDSTWCGCSGLTSFPLINTALGTVFSSTWQNCSGLTSFPLLNTGAGTNFDYAWYGCSGLTSFPLINTALGTNFTQTWRGCSGLTSFPLLDMNKCNYFNQTWYGCSAMTTFPAGFFDSWAATPSTNCFQNTWYNCTALTQTSLQNIVVSLVASGKSAPASGTTITLNGAPTLATMQADTTTFMPAITTLKSRNWTPTYKGTAL